jgi:two-component system LytT family sensor kinase
MHLLANTLGHAAGVLLFGTFLGLLVGYRRSLRLRGSRLSILAAALALVWNLASLIGLGWEDGSRFPASVVAALAFASLSLLPAVLLHLCLLGRFRILVAAGYLLSAVAVGLHLAELPAFPYPQFHRLGLRLITYGFGLLTLASVAGVLASRERSPRSLTPRILAAMSLLLFAISFVHFGEGHAHPALSTEYALHHAGIPLALFVLLQDYRSVLLDAFIRFLANALLAALVTASVVAAAAHFAPEARPQNPFHEGLLLGAGCLLLILYSSASGGLRHWLTRIVFRQPAAEPAAQRLRRLAAEARDEADFLDQATRHLAGLMDAEVVACDCASQLRGYDLVLPVLVTDLARPPAELERSGAEVIVPLRAGADEMRYALLGRRHGGRRYLSGDLDLLARLAARIAEQVEAFRESEMRRLVSQAELRALQAQIHPHFLFNALNTLYGIIPKEATGARRTVLNLADIFRYFLQPEKTLVPLAEELRIVEAYLEIEKLRLGDKLTVEMAVEREAAAARIPLLSIQPLVENAIKHGVARKNAGGRVRVAVRRSAGRLEIAVEDTGGGFASPGDARRQHAGMGLENVERRLKLCYGPEARLRIDSTPAGSAVGFSVPAPALAEAAR